MPKEKNLATDDRPFGVKVLSPGTEPVVDLVAVHGLDGHQEHTWRADNGVLWLRDCLPLSVPNARILAYGYDGRTRGSTLSSQKLHDYAVALVADLTLYRDDSDTRKRPIIFIAHGVGGITVKDALIYSNSTNEGHLEKYNAIKTSTYGILFFDTPHQGTEVTKWTRNVKDTVALKNIDQDVLKSVEKNSEMLQKQTVQFNPISRDFNTKFFLGAYESSSSKAPAVGKTSAVVPGATDAEQFWISSTHEEMVRYKSKDDEGFKKVSSCLRSMVEAAPGKVLENWEKWIRVKAAKSNGVPITFAIPFEPEYPRNEHFTGRQDLLDQLYRMIQVPQPAVATVVLYGTGGMGKTQIASEYVYAHQDDYQSIFWINASSKESIELGFRTAAQRLIRQHAKLAHGTKPNYSLIAKSLDMVDVVDENGLVSSHNDHTECIIRGVKLWLSKKGNKNWLLVFDNVDDLEHLAINTFIPTAAHAYGRVIITSRRADFGSLGIGLEVDVMQEQEGKDLLLKSAAPEGQEDPNAEKLATKLGFLPLALVQAGAYIAVCKISFERYLNIYENYFNEVFRTREAWSFGDRTVRTTWEISFEAIKKKDAKAAELLSLCSFLFNEDIQDDMLRRGQNLDKDDITLGEKLGLLFSYSLAQRKGSNDTFHIHPVVHLWAHERLQESERVQETKKALGLVAVATRSSGLELLLEVEYKNRILPHIMIISKNFKRYLKTKPIDLITATWIGAMGYSLSKRGKLDEAEELQLQVVQSRQSILGSEHPETLSSMNNLAATYSHQGRHKEAEELKLQAAQSMESILGSEHPNTLSAMNNLAATYSHQGRHKEAEELQLQVVQSMQSILGSGHPLTFLAMGNLAGIYSHRGRHKESKELQLQVVQLKQSILGSGHPDTLASMSNLAVAYSYQGQYKEAEELESQVVQFKQSILGGEHPETLSSMSNLASTYSNQGRHKEAEELRLQMVQSMQSILGSEHPSTLLDMGNLATTYSDQGRHKEAEELQLQVVQSRQSILGSRHPDTLSSMGNLATTYSDQGRHKEAEELRLQVVQSMQSILGSGHPDTLSSMGSLAITYSHQGRHKEAEELQLQVVQSMQSILGSEHPYTLPAMGNLAVIYSGQGRHKEAEELQLQVVRSMQSILGSEHPDTLSAMSNLANFKRKRSSAADITLSEDKMMQMALDMSLQPENSDESSGRCDAQNEDDPIRAVNHLADAFGETHPETINAMSSLAMALSNQGRWTEVEKLELRVVDAVECTLGKENPNTLRARANSGITYMKQNRWKEAEELFLQVVEAMKRVLTIDHPDTQRATVCLGKCYQGQGRQEEANELIERIENEMLERAIARSRNPEQSSSDNSRQSSSQSETEPSKKRAEYLTTMANQAATYWDLGQWKEAEDLELKVMKSRQITRGKQHLSTLLTMTNLAGTYGDQGRWKEAEELELQVMEARKETLGNTHPDTLTAIANLAMTYTCQQKWKEAEKLYLQVTRASESLGEDPRALSAMALLATNHWHRGDFEKAEEIELKVVESRRRVLGDEHQDTLMAVGNLAATYASQNRYDDAEKLQNELVKAFVKTLGNRHSDTISAESLVQVPGGKD